MATHVKIIAVVYALFGAMAVVGVFFGSLIFGALGVFVGSQVDQGAGIAAALMGFVGVTLMVVLLFFAAFSVVCSWGLWRFRPWARIMAIILGAIGLTKFPVGTLFGVYVLAIMFRKDTEELFARST
jgi:hypothetical protein